MSYTNREETLCVRDSDEGNLKKSDEVRFREILFYNSSVLDVPIIPEMYSSSRYPVQ